MRPVLVGIAPSRVGAEGQPLTSLGGPSTGRRLAELSGLTPTEYLRRFDRVNLWPSPTRSTISIKRGRPNAENLAGSILRGRRVVLLGTNVAECFGLTRGREYARFCEWFELGDRPDWYGAAGYVAGRTSPPFSFAVLPHPSGRNRWYNDPVNVDRATRLMTALAGARAHHEESKQ